MRYVCEFWQEISERKVPLAAVLTGVSLFILLYATVWSVRVVRMAKKRKRREKMRRAEKERRLEYT